MVEFMPKLPDGCAACTACGHVMNMTIPAVHRLPRFLPFSLRGCSRCGHLMAQAKDRYRDLTRAEAEELRNSPRFDFVRECVEKVTERLIG